VTDAVEALGQDVRQEAADELVGRQRHGLVAAKSLDPVILPFEGEGQFRRNGPSDPGQCHEKPKLQSIEVNDNPQNPVHMQIDLTGLLDEDLQALARILPKLGGSNGPVPDQGGAGGGPRGDTAPDRATRAPNGRKGPRQIAR
jgi:hypothetical protein